MPRWNVHFDLIAKQFEPGVLERIALTHSLARTIRDIPVPPHVQTRLHTLNIVRAVRGTTGIEGVTLSEEEVSAVLRSTDSPEGEVALTSARRREEQEVRNAAALMRFVESVLRHDPNRPLTEVLVRRFHEILTSDIDYPHNEPGRYRSGPANAGSYLAPPPEDVQPLVSKLFQWVNGGAGNNLDPVIRAIVAHFLMVNIHPFGDGNGRTSRAVECYLLYKSGVNVRGFYSLANYYYQHRAKYIDLLTHVRFVSDPDCTPFVKFALQGLVGELEQMHSELISEIRVISFRDYAREQLQFSGRLGTKTGDRQLLFLFMLGTERVSLRDIRNGSHSLAHIYRGVGAKTISRDMNKLQNLGLILIEDGFVSANTSVMDHFIAGSIQP